MDSTAMSKTHFHIGHNKYVNSSSFQGKDYFHIRVYEKNYTTGKFYPTNRGIALTLPRFKSLCYMVGLIDEALKKGEEVSHHIGGNVFISSSKTFGVVDIRQFFMFEKRLQATRKGINLKSSEWENLKKFINTAEEYLPTLADVIPCYEENDHLNQEGAYACVECYPNGPPDQE